MAVEVETCGSCCLKLKDLIKGYENELGLTGSNADGTKSKCFPWLYNVSNNVYFVLFFVHNFFVQIVFKCLFSISFCL